MAPNWQLYHFLRSEISTTFSQTRELFQETDNYLSETVKLYQLIQEYNLLQPNNLLFWIPTPEPVPSLTAILPALMQAFTFP